MEKLKALFVMAVAAVALCSCSAQAVKEESGSICVASWNVQNLFDARPDGTEYSEYTPDSGWTASMYERRLENVRTVLSYLPSAGDYIIVLNEIEGPKVIEDLIKVHKIANMGLCWFACAGAQGGAIQTAVVSSMPFVGARVHDVGQDLRPVLEVEFETPRGKLFVLAVHFKSNVGGVLETAERRRKAALATAQIAKAIELQNPGCIVLVCGDMNDECWENGVLARGGELPTSGRFCWDAWYCFWLDEGLSLWPIGSYLYDDIWRCYDNILISQAGNDGSGYEYSKAGVVFKGILVSADSKPAKWDRRLLKGVSDHLPVWIIMH